MKILHVASDLYPDIIGGIGIHVHEISKWQIKSGHSVTIFTLNHNRFPGIEIINNCKVIRFDIFMKILGNSFSFQLIPALYKQYRNYDIIHAHSHLFFSTALCSVIRLTKKKPLIITCHGLLSASAPKWLNSLYMIMFSKPIFHIADHIICLTELEKKTLVNLGIEDTKISVIPNGIDIDLFFPNTKLRENGQKQILWVGRFVPGKCVEDLVDAFFLVHRNHPDTNLVLVGDGPLLKDIQQKVASLHLTQNVKFIKQLEHSELPELYNRSHVFVLPSLMEGMPLTILESMSCGVPVIITEFPHLKELIEGSGIFVPPKNAEKLAEEITFLVEDEKYSHQLGTHGRGVIEDGYSWQNTAGKTVALYEKLVG